METTVTYPEIMITLASDNEAPGGNDQPIDSLNNDMTMDIPDLSLLRRYGQLASDAEAKNSDFIMIVPSGSKIVDESNITLVKCKHSGCPRRASVALPGELVPEYCTRHRKRPMVKVDTAICNKPGCNKNATYGYEDDTATLCLLHKETDMLHIRFRHCSVQDCRERATHGPYGFDPTHCINHSSIEMARTQSSRCHKNGCTIKPSYNFDHPGSIPILCRNHKHTGMINVRTKRYRESVNAKGGRKWKTGKNNRKRRVENHGDVITRIQTSSVIASNDILATDGSNINNINIDRELEYFGW